MFNIIIKFFRQILGETSGNYGHDTILRICTKYPKYLPLNARIQHGWYTEEIPELKKKNLSLMLTWNKRIARKWEEQSNIPVYVLGAPFILYRRMKKIRIKNKAEGTVAFPHHSTKNVSVKYNIHEYCRVLSSLPKNLKPITICLHYRDFENQASYYKNYGFSVVTAGESRQGETGFVDKFYEILSNHCYSTSNAIGSYTFYAIEIGIPFSLYGPGSVARNRKDNNNIINKGNFYEKAKDIFEGINTKISSEQRQFVLEEVGIDDTINPKDLRRIFLKRLFFYEIPRYPLRFIKTIINGIIYIFNNEKNIQVYKEDIK